MMKKTVKPPRFVARRLPALLGLALLALPACFLFEEKMSESTVALVNGLPVTIQEVDERYRRLEKEMDPSAPKDEKGASRLRKAVLKELINRKLLVSEARRRGIKVLAEELRREKERFSSGLTPDEMKEVLAGARITPEELDESLGEELSIRHLMESITAGVAVTDAEIAAYYEKNRNQFFQQEAVKARQIVVGSEAEGKKVRRRLAAGEDFAKVAEDVSMSPDALNGGDLGFFQRGQMPREIEDAAFALKPGQVSQVIETPYGFHLLKVEERRPAKQLEQAEAKGGIVEILTRKKSEEGYKTLLAGLSKTADIRFNRRYRELAK